MAVPMQTPPFQILNQTFRWLIQPHNRCCCMTRTGVSRMSSRAVSSILAEMQRHACGATDPKNNTAQLALLRLSRELTHKLEEPLDVISSMAYAGVRSACVRIADDMALFKLLSEKSPCTVSELASTVDADEALILRLLRTLAAMDFVEQVGSDSFSSTQISRHLTLPNVQSGLRFFIDQWNPVLSHATEYFQKNGYRIPQSTTDGLFQFAHGTSDDCYSFWSKQPGVMQNFNTFMRGRFETAARLHWADWFPLDNVCLSGFDSEMSEYCFVDVGGGRGHESELVLKRHPDTKGRFVLEDLPEVLIDIEGLHSRIEKVAYDFTEPQLVKGARTYFFKNIFHNWPWQICRTILSRTRDAMIPGYSKVLIINIILPDNYAPLRACEMDMGMLFMHSGSQRCSSEWQDLVESAGLQIARQWCPPGDGDGVIEVQLPVGGTAIE